MIKYFIGVPSISVSIFTRSDKQKMFISSLVAEPRGVLGASAPLQFSTINQEVEEKNEEEEEEKRGGRKKRRKMSLSKSKF